MKSILILIVMSLVFNVVALIAVEAIPSAPQTREDIYIMMKEELMLTVDIYKTQVDILTMTLSLQQRNINMQNDQFSSQIDELSRLKQYEGKFSAEQIDALQKQLDSTREDMSAANLNLDQLAIKVKQAEKKIQDYYDRVNALALQFIKEVESNKKPDLPRGILPTMRESSAVMAKATIETGMDKKAFDTFMGAVDQYIKFVISYGGETDALMQKQQQLLQAYSSADFAYLQYISTKLQLQ
ncbi:MAG: hypothetical protein U1B83_07355, partial [Candidatus Cloacimonadaceae bacterium]|nr:hypothetical protein [Candidatus Cloacimonadaceae bacterium]